MASFDSINYSLRPSKSIERQLVFEGVRTLQPLLNLERMAYVGFGSIWFTDFIMAHKLLRIDDMVSMEVDEIGYRRGLFNSPYATVRVLAGLASGILPTLYSGDPISGRPWMIWLDYDYAFRESLADDLRSVIENVSSNSILLVTFNGHEGSYGKPVDRPARLRELFGKVVPDELSKEDCVKERMQSSLADFTLDLMKSIAFDQSRPGGFVPAFRLLYQDGAPMVTVGGLLPAKGAARVASDAVNDPDWPCFARKPIAAPHLTLREAAVLQSQFPKTVPMTRAQVQSLGFDLQEEQIEAFEAYYRLYPSFAQILA